MNQRITALVAATLFGSSAFAAQECVGTVQTLAFNPGSGLLQVSIGYGVQYMCSFNSTVNGVDPQTCKSWYAMLMTAKASDKRISMIYDTSAACNQMGNWSVPNPLPYFVQIVD
jgi:hypothetical protein